MIRAAEKRDIAEIMELLNEVRTVHHLIRPDIFAGTGTKYSPSELEAILTNEDTPVLVFDDCGVKGYAFLKIIKHSDPMLVPYTEIYIDDICVDRQSRGKGIASSLFNAVKVKGAEVGADRLTLNVWEGNGAARSFYEKMGMSVQKSTMEFKI